MTEWYVRTETCEQCGECCANGPWPSSWPRDLLGKSVDEIKKIFPHGVIFFGLVSGRDQAPTKGISHVAGKEYPWQWVERHGYVKGPDNYECPFLTQDGDRRPCALVGTDFEHAFRVGCLEYESGIPPFRSHDKQVERWERDHPNCTFKYVKEE